eukprot:4829865-Amphidinium_carterae.1
MDCSVDIPQKAHKPPEHSGSSDSVCFYGRLFLRRQRQSSVGQTWQTVQATPKNANHDTDC